MANPMTIATTTSRASRQPLFANRQRHKTTKTIEINIPPGNTNERDGSAGLRSQENSDSLQPADAPSRLNSVRCRYTQLESKGTARPMRSAPQSVQRV